MDHPEKHFYINYNDLNDESKARFDAFVRECGGGDAEVENEHSTEVLASVTESDLEIGSDFDIDDYAAHIAEQDAWQETLVSVQASPCCKFGSI